MPEHTKQERQFIAGAIKKPGSLRAWLIKVGILKDDKQKVTASILNQATPIARKIQDPKRRATMLRRINLARTLLKLG